MAVANWALGRTGQLYCVEETAYDTVSTQLATTAVRHLNVAMHYDPKSFTKSPERHTHPSQLQVLTRRTQATWGIKGQMYPSGTLNTLPEITAILKAAFGAAPSNITLATTVSSGAGVSGAVVASATGLAARQPIQIVVAGGAAPGTYIRWLTAAYAGGTTLTWEPPLQATCAVADTIKGCTGYALGTTPAKSLDICHYPQSPSTWYNREMLGAVLEKLILNFDSNLEPMFDASGPACEMVTAQSQPGGFTTVGSESSIQSGLTGYLQYGSTLYQIEKLSFEITNMMALQNTALGTAKAVGFYRKNKRALVVKVNAKVSDDLTLYTPSMTPSSGTLMLQIGTTATKLWALYLPIAQFMRPPDAPDADETNNWDFEFMPLGSAGNDEAYLAQG